MADHTRRRFVQVAGSAGIVALAWCSGGDGGGDEMAEDGGTSDGDRDSPDTWSS